ncbi:peptidylprolyl isomerase [Xanthomonas sp. NCPPB 1638]|uniref:peptidylprolyl isomerase n=1 Tax=Xanthomonas TaxID=338 RepID=UPI001CB79006|nr:peptidylprolyl isomerase [Xanthomonas cucurbitae]
MSSIRLALSALAVALIYTACLRADAAAITTSGTVMQIGPQSLNAQEYRALALADLPKEINPATAADPAFVREFADRLLLVQEAQREHLQDDPVVAARIRQATDAILTKAVQTRARDTAKIDAAQIKAQFDAHPHDYDEVHLRHLFVALQPQGDARGGTPLNDAQALARAQHLKQQLDAGVPFAELAMRESDDGSTAAEGGELSPIFQRNLADAFVAPVQGLGEGEVSAPVRGPEGYHLIRLDARRPATLDSAAGQIDVQLRDQAAATTLAQLRQANPLSVDHVALEAALR